jgi:hypothetical protein
LHKYHAQPTEVDGLRFASKKEAKRWGELSLLQRAGEIRDLKRQVRYDLCVNDIKICSYIADFTYHEHRRVRSSVGASFVVEDTKGVRTPLYSLKAKLMKAIHGITIRET